MTIILILLTALGGLLAAWAWAEAARQRKRAKQAEAALKMQQRRLEKMQEAYRAEAERLAELARGSDAERFDASIRILRELSRHANNSD